MARNKRYKAVTHRNDAALTNAMLGLDDDNYSRYSDEDIYRGLFTVYTRWYHSMMDNNRQYRLSKFTLGDYNTFRKENEPSSSTLVKYFGSWTEAVNNIPVEHLRKGTWEYDYVLMQGAVSIMSAIMETYLIDDVEDMTVIDYNTYRSEHNEIPQWETLAEYINPGEKKWKKLVSVVREEMNK